MDFSSFGDVGIRLSVNNFGTKKHTNFLSGVFFLLFEFQVTTEIIVMGKEKKNRGIEIVSVLSTVVSSYYLNLNQLVD